MSLFGSLFTGVSALSAQSQSIAMISNNIANVNTVGYKRSDAAFESLVTSQSRNSRYSPGSVIASRQQRVGEQGALLQTNSTTDAAISGNGFFVVQRTTGSDAEVLYTRNGSFSEDAQGFLRNTSGYFLMGWPLDGQGNLPAGQADLSSLSPVDVAFLGGLTRPTDSGEIALNLNAAETAYNNGLGSNTLPVPSSIGADFTRGFRVFDSLGTPQDLNFEFRKIVGPMATETSGAFGLNAADNLVTVLAGINAGDVFTISDGTTSEDVIIGAAAGAGQTRVDTVQDLLDFFNTGFGAGTELEARLTDDGRILLQATDLSVSLTFTDVTGTPVGGATGLSFTEGVAIAPAATYTNQSDFPTYANTTNPNTQGWWEVTVTYDDGTEVTKGLLSFNGDGTLNALADAEGEIKINLDALDWGNGSSLQNIDIDIDRFTQFSGNYNVIFTDQNGAELGLRTGVDIDREGFVVARFSNGQSTRLYKLPVATFASPDGLDEKSGTAYSESDESGDFNLREAGAGGAGLLEGSTLENSNVDLADEFAKMIITQRAYSAGTRVISTADQMTEELLRLR